MMAPTGNAARCRPGMLFRVFEREADLAGFWSIFSTRTRTFCPSCTISLGCFTRSQLSWLTWIRPSTPPRSTNAPKSWILRTIPSRICPGSSSASRAFFDSSFSRSSTARRLRTRLPRRSLDSVTTQTSFCPTKSPRFSTRYRRNLAGGDEAAEARDLAFQAAGVGGRDRWLRRASLRDLRPIAGDDRSAGDRQIVQVVFAVEAGDDHVDHRRRRLGGSAKLRRLATP